MFTGFKDLNVPVNDDVEIYGKWGGDGPPLLLLHGFPQNHLIWHRVAEELVKKCTVIAIDLRGYGQSSKPASDENHRAYSKGVMAKDCVMVMESLGYHTFYVCAHDRGARVAHKLAVDHPSSVKKLILLDIAPTLAMYTKTDFLFAKAYYHWFFLIQPVPFPEDMILADPDSFMEHHVSRAGRGRQIFADECYQSYLAMMRDRDAVHAMCEDYRASASIDMEEHKADEEEGRKIQCPLLVLWGKHGLIEKKFNAIEEWQHVSSSSVEGEALDCGHYIPEEAPDALLTHISRFFNS